MLSNAFIKLDKLNFETNKNNNDWIYVLENKFVKPIYRSYYVSLFLEY